MISKIDNVKGKPYGYKEYVVDNLTDIADLPVEVTTGSTAFVIQNSSLYMLNGSKQWVLITGSSSSSGNDDDDTIYDGGTET